MARRRAPDHTFKFFHSLLTLRQLGNKRQGAFFRDIRGYCQRCYQLTAQSFQLLITFLCQCFARLCQKNGPVKPLLKQPHFCQIVQHPADRRAGNSQSLRNIYGTYTLLIIRQPDTAIRYRVCERVSFMSLHPSEKGRDNMPALPRSVSRDGRYRNSHNCHSRSRRRIYGFFCL
jgi:hypothetical protein